MTRSSLHPTLSSLSSKTMNAKPLTSTPRQWQQRRAKRPQRLSLSSSSSSSLSPSSSPSSSPSLLLASSWSSFPCGGNIISFLFSLLLLSMSLTTRVSAQLFGYQSGGIGTSFPGSMAYDPNTKLIYLTGMTFNGGDGSYWDEYDSGGVGGLKDMGAVGDGVGDNSNGEGDGDDGGDCFLAILRAPTSPQDDETDTDTENSPDNRTSIIVPLHSFRFGTLSRPEACSSISTYPSSAQNDGESATATPSSRGRVALVGHTEKGGYATGLEEFGDDKVTAYGFALDIDLILSDSAQEEAAGAGDANGDEALKGGVGMHAIEGGRLLHFNKVQYPVASAVQPASSNGEGIIGSRETLFVAMLTTDDDTINPHWHSSTSASASASTATAIIPHDLTAGTDPTWTGSASLPSEDGIIGENGGGGKASDTADDAAAGSGSWHKYGRNFNVIVMKLHRKTEIEVEETESQIERKGGGQYPVKETMKAEWEQFFATSEEDVSAGGAGGASHRSGVLLSNLLYVSHPSSISGTNLDFLLMVGSTRGYGSAFGSNVRMDEGGWDGFATKLSPETGLELTPMTIEDELRHPHSIRIKSENGMDDVIRGACVYSPTTTTTTTASDGTSGGPVAYIVGTTRGIFDEASFPGGRESVEALDPLDPLPFESTFLIKIDLDRMSVTWKKQLVGLKDGSSYVSSAAVIGVGCAVSADGNDVYVGGSVKDGGTIVHKDLERTASYGNDDVYVARVDASTGEIHWVRQMGSYKDEWLAKGGGIAAVESEGAILFGGTRGSFMRRRGGGDVEGKDDDVAFPASDVFVVSVSSNGTFLSSMDPALSPGGGGGGPSTGTGGMRPSDVPGGTPFDPSMPTFPDQPVGNVPEASVEDRGKLEMSPNNTPSKSFSRALGLFVLLLLGSAVSVFLFAAAYRIGARKAHLRSLYGPGGGISHEHVTKYLQDFDEVDVAIRASATGGWHGMYDFGDEHSQLMAGLGKVPDEVTVTLSQISRDTDGSRSGGRGSSPPLRLPSSGGSAASHASTSSIVKESLFFDDDEDDHHHAISGSRHRASFSTEKNNNYDDDDDDEDYGERYDDDDERRRGRRRRHHGDYDDVYDDEEEAGTPWGAGYEGLVESYNNTWDDRNPHSLGGAGGGVVVVGGGGVVVGGRRSMTMSGGGGSGHGHGDYGDEQDPKLNEIL